MISPRQTRVDEKSYETINPNMKGEMLSEKEVEIWILTEQKKGDNKMKRIHYAVMATIITTMLFVGNAHSGSGTSFGNKNEDSVPTPTPLTEPKNEVTLSEIGDPLYPELCSCGQNTYIPDGERFEIILNGEAFVDKATCLIWETSPKKFVDPYGYPIELGLTFDETEDYCRNLETGGRDDWRVPNVMELMLLEEPLDGSIMPRELDDQCGWLWEVNSQYFDCDGWTNTPAIGQDEEKYIITIDSHYPNQSNLSITNIYNREYPLCVTGTANIGYYND